ncbi:encD, partial [Mucuna pruriens]
MNILEVRTLLQIKYGWQGRWLWNLEEEAEVDLPIIDLSSPDRLPTAISIHQYGFFYVVNHRLENDLVKAFDESRRFFSLPLQDKENRGYSPLDANLVSKGILLATIRKRDSKENYYIGPLADLSSADMNQWPSQELLGNWRPSMESLNWKLFGVGKKLLSLIAISLNVDEGFFEKIGAINKPAGSVFSPFAQSRFSEMGPHQEICSSHSDFGTLTLLLTYGVPGLQ